METEIQSVLHFAFVIHTDRFSQSRYSIREKFYFAQIALFSRIASKINTRAG